MTLMGRTLGRYRLEEPLGQGGMAEVYRAVDGKLGRTVAVKVILSTHSRERHFVGRFLQEAQLIAKLEHPSILPVYDFGEEGGVPFLVMPFLEGGTLRERMLGRPIPFPLAVSWVRQLGDALDAAHAAGVLHRDVKPANVLIGKDERLFLADFGIAKLLDQTTGLTATGTVVGTPVYMAPEQAQGKPTTPASDRYALAVIAWELLTGQPPFDAESPLALMNQHVTAPVPALSSCVAGLPAGLDLVFEKALAKRPEERPPSCRSFADLLQGFLPSGARQLAEVPTTPWVAPFTAEQTAGTRIEPTPKHLASTPRSQLTSDPTVSTAPREGARRPMVLGAVLGAAAVALVGAGFLVRPLLTDRGRAPVLPAPAPSTPVPVPPAAPVATVPAGPAGRVEVVELGDSRAGGAEPGRLDAATRAVADAVRRGQLVPPDSGNALEALARLEREFPASPNVAMAKALVAGALKARATASLEKGDREAARADLQRAQTLVPDDREARDRLAGLESRAAARPAGPPADGREGSDRREAKLVLAGVLEGHRRATRADYEAALAAVQAQPADASRPGPLAIGTLARGGLAYLSRRDDEAGRLLLEAAAVLRTNPGPGMRDLFQSVPIRIATRWQASRDSGPPTGWALALAFGDARREAEGLLATDLGRNPADPRALLGRAVLRRMDGQLAAAIEDASRSWDAAPAGDPISASAALLLSDLHRDAGHPAEAAEWLAKATGGPRPGLLRRRDRPAGNP